MSDLGCSLWLQPPKGSPIYSALKSMIEGLGTLFEDGENFEPHITITSKIIVSNQAQVDLILDHVVTAARSVPLTVDVNHLSFGKQFFKKVYFNVVRTASVVGLAQICREEFVILPHLIHSTKNYHAMSPEERETIQNRAMAAASDWAASEYDPHISLVYSNAYPVDEALQRTVITRVDDVFGANYSEVSWTGGTISLVQTVGPIEEWNVLGERTI